MKVISIDPGSKSLGWCHIVDNKVEMVDTLKLPGNTPDTYTLLHYFIRMQLEGIIVSYKRIIPEYLILESFYTQSFKGTTIIPELRGIIKLAVYQMRNVKLIEVAPGTVKKFITGSGLAKKEDIAGAILEKYSDNPAITPKLSSDAFDAIAIGYTGINKIEQGLIEVKNEEVPE